MGYMFSVQAHEAVLTLNLVLTASAPSDYSTAWPKGCFRDAAFVTLAARMARLVLYRRGTTPRQVACALALVKVYHWWNNAVCKHSRVCARSVYLASFKSHSQEPRVYGIEANTATLTRCSTALPLLSACAHVKRGTGLPQSCTKQSVEPDRHGTCLYTCSWCYTWYTIDRDAPSPGTVVRQPGKLVPTKGARATYAAEAHLRPHESKLLVR